MEGSPAHLFRRFFDVLTAQGLTVVETEAVRHRLTPELGELFFSQPPADQRHAYQAGLVVVAGGQAHSDVVVAALMHDVGKRHSRLGVIGRSVASIAVRLHLPLGDRMTAYRDHGMLAARELAGAGAVPLVVDFARHHHGERPSSISQQVWDLLLAADQPPKALASIRGRITSQAR